MMACGPEIVYLPPGARVVMKEETRAMLFGEQGATASVKSRFRELLEQHPEMTRPQAYTQAVLEMGDRIIAEAAKRMESDDD